VHRPSVTVTVADAANPAVAAFAVAAFADAVAAFADAVAAFADADADADAVRLAPDAAGAAVAAPAEPQATTPTMSTAEPANIARIPIAHRSISCAACW
jgi:hypothetical protein